MLRGLEGDMIRDLQHWLKEGFTAAEANAWAQSFPSAQWARIWQQAGFSANEAADWDLSEIDIPEAAQYREAGVTVQQGLGWRHAGLQAREVIRAIHDNLDPEHAVDRVWQEAGFTPQEHADWFAAFSRPPLPTRELLAEAKLWRAANISGQQMRKYRSDPDAPLNLYDCVEAGRLQGSDVERLALNMSRNEYDEFLATSPPANAPVDISQFMARATAWLVRGFSLDELLACARQGLRPGDLVDDPVLRAAVVVHDQ